MALSYEEALATLQSMFAEPWTRDTLDAVLRHQKGHMENTVDFLLRHGDKDPQMLVDQLAAGKNPDDDTTALDEQLARQLSSPNSGMPSENSSTPAATSSSSGRGIPVTLPDDFLRIPGAGSGSQMESDAALARMLQDQMLSESQQQQRRRTQQRSSSRNVFPGGQAAAGGQPQVNIMDQLSAFGNTARKQFQLFASQVKDRAEGLAAGVPMSATNSNVTNSTNTNSTGNAGGFEMGESRGLLDDNDDDDHDAHRYGNANLAGQTPL